MGTTTTDPDAVAYAKWCFLAEKVEREPEWLEIPLDNIDRWSMGGRGGLRFLQK